MSQNRITALCGLLLAFSPPARPAGALERTLTPTLTMQQEYNDNIFFSAADQTADLTTVLRPGLGFRQRDERLDLRLQAALTANGYRRHSDLNSLEHLYEVTGAYRLRPTVQLHSEARYVRDSRPDRDLATTGQTLSTARREKLHGRLAGEVTLSEISSWGASLAFDRDVYGSSTFSGYHAYQLGFTTKRDLSGLLRRTTAQASLDYHHYSFSTVKTENLSLGLGGVAELSERSSVTGWLGPTWTRQELGGDNEQDWGGIGFFSLRHEWQTSSLALELTRQIAPDTGRDGTVDRRSLLMRFNLRQGEDRRWRFRLRAFDNRASSSLAATASNELTMEFAARGRQRLTRTLWLEAGYTHTAIHDRNNNGNRSRNLLLARLVYRSPLR